MQVGAIKLKYDNFIILIVDTKALVGVLTLYFYCSEMSTRRSSRKLETIIIENTKAEMGNWIPFHVSIGSWVTLHPSRNQIWAKRRRLDDLKSHWKGIIKAFKRSQSGEKVEKVPIAHVYEHKDILKESVSQQKNIPQIGLNCKGSSFYNP